MRWSLKIARVAGIDVRIHLTFLLFLAWIAFAYHGQGGPAAAAQAVIFILALFGCVLLHEFGHALAARLFGVRTPDITLLPIGGVARLQRMPEHPVQELVVALAGPAVNVLIAAILMLGFGAQPDFGSIEHMDDPSGGLLAKLAAVNISLVLFNLIPAFPMDGGRVLRALLALRMNYARATHIAAGIGQALAVGFGFVGLFHNPMLIFIALFIYFGARQEAALAVMKELARDLSVYEAMLSPVVRLPFYANIEEAVGTLLRTHQPAFPVVDAGERVIGLLTRDDMISAWKRYGADARVGDVMQRDVPFVHPHAPLSEAFATMQECGCPALPVADRFGRLVGLVGIENAGELLLVNSLRPRFELPVWRHA